MKAKSDSKETAKQLEGMHKMQKGLVCKNNYKLLSKIEKALYILLGKAIINDNGEYTLTDDELI